METASGIFHSQSEARQAVQSLHEVGIPFENINLLVPGISEEHVDEVPTSDTEQPGMGQALGAVVGGTIGASGGLFATAIASALIPGIGPVTAVGLVAAALFGVGGAATGAAVGGSVETAMSDGLPKDELFVYDHALLQGYSVVIALTEDSDQYEAARNVLDAAGAESINAARDKWWVGTYDAAEEIHGEQNQPLLRDRIEYRRGFEAALRPETYGQSYEEAQAYLQTAHPDIYRDEAFQRGYIQGQAYSKSLHERWAGATTTRHSANRVQRPNDSG
jgi:hypothetical protein